MRHSSCSWVAASSLNPNGGTVWPKGTSVGYNPCMRMSSGCCDEGRWAHTSFGPLSAVMFHHSVS
jgi:hypothetical protein